MPILDGGRTPDHRHQAWQGHRFAGIENALFYADNTRMLYADGKEAATRLLAELKALEGGSH